MITFASISKTIKKNTFIAWESSILIILNNSFRFPFIVVKVIIAMTNILKSIFARFIKFWGDTKTLSLKFVQVGAILLKLGFNFFTVNKNLVWAKLTPTPTIKAANKIIPAVLATKNIIFKNKFTWYYELNLNSNKRDVLTPLMWINNKKYDNIYTIRNNITIIAKELIYIRI